jgi:hypothetical protein
MDSHSMLRTEELQTSNSALDDIQRKPGEAGFLVSRLHIEAGEVHGADHLVE